ncbi:MAG: peptidoglycan -binding protein [Hyphomicrobiaceae bacterium]|nr:peptidoglycan -binding protein [Hyphomicrobiaceae bacterium]
MGRARSRRNEDMSWPAYVDVLSTLLLVVTFLMSIFMTAQYYSGLELSGKDTALLRLNRQIAELTNLLSLEKGRSKTGEDDLATLQASLNALKEENAKLQNFAVTSDEKSKTEAGRVGSLSADLEAQKAISNEALAKVDLLNQQMLALRKQMAALNEALGASEKKDEESQERIKDLGSRLNAALARQVQELQRYRSDFFGRLRDLLKDRQDIRVVGDRFVFQSEILFPSGSADMTPEGLGTIDQLATAINELRSKIPAEIDWAFQVDGHTDSRPIASSSFPSNWELSTARAVSVVKYLASKGVPPERLVAAGHGEFQPLENGTDDESLRKNRRIELKLTNK